MEFLPLEEEYARQRIAAAGRKSAPGKPEKGSQTFDYLSPNAGRATERAAKKMGTNRQSVSDAAKIKQEDPNFAPVAPPAP